MKKFLGACLILFGSIVPFVEGCTKGPPAPGFLSGESQNEPQDRGSLNEYLAKESGKTSLVYHIGPVDLPAGAIPSQMIERPLVMKFHVDDPLWVVGFESKVLDRTGAKLPSSLLCRATVSNLHEENISCSEGAQGNPFVVSSSLLTTITFPDGYGYPILPGDPLEAKVILQNPTDKDYVDVLFELELVVRPMNEFTNFRDIKPMLLDLDPCTFSPLQVAPQEFEERQAVFSIPHDANLLLAFGAVHNYASYVELYRKNEASPFWRAEASLDARHNLLELSNNPFEDPAGVKFKKGDTITLGVAYDNPNDSWLKDASSSVMAYFWLE